MTEPHHQANETERAVLGEILFDPECLVTVREVLTAVDFHQESHRRIFKAMCDLEDRGDVIDLITLEAQLSRTGDVERIGGASYCVDLVTDVFTSINAKRHAELVKESANLRRIDAALCKILSDFRKGEPFDLSHLQELANITTTSTKSFFEQLTTGAELKTLNISVEWLVDGLVPRGAVTLFYARGGMGKSTLIAQVAGAVSKGQTFFGLNTQLAQVFYVDFENPPAILAERAKRIDLDHVAFWHSSNRPPKLDKLEWGKYLQLAKECPGSLFIFDTLRSSQSGDENSSQDMNPVMERLRELRDAGATVIILHHTTKAAETKYKGSTAIFDMSDHILALYPVKKGTDQELEDDCDDSEKVYRFGTKDKTRYAPFKMHLTFDKNTGLFQPSSAPEVAELKILQNIIADIHSRTAATQKAIIEHAQQSYGALIDSSERNMRKLLKIGAGVYWGATKGLYNATIYTPIDASLTEHHLEEREQPPASSEFDSFSDPVCQTVKHHKHAVSESDRLLGMIWGENEQFQFASNSV